MIDVLIITFNESINLPHALRSVMPWARNVFVVDSESTDDTRRIAEEMGAKVYIQPWLGYARQKNWALDNLPFESDWIFILDADESITPELRDELLAIASRPVHQVPEAGFYVNRLTYFMNRPIRHCGFFPAYNLRFFKRGRARYEEREVHEHMIVDGPTARLRNMMIHNDRRGLEHYIAKHNRYSTLEARELFRYQMQRASGQAQKLERGIGFRRWVKHNILPRIPCAWMARFFYMYFLRLGFLDGVAGFRFAVFLTVYDMFITLKLNELKTSAAEGDRPLERPASATPRGLAVPEGEMNSATTTG